MCAESSGRIERIVTPSAASRTSSTTAVVAVKRSFPAVGSRFRHARTKAPSDEALVRALSSRPHRCPHNGVMRVLIVEDETKLANLIAARGWTGTDSPPTFTGGNR